MIRIERVALPPGLRATAHRDPRGDLVIYVSSALDARRQRAAVVEAVRATRRAGWRVGGALPLGVVAFAFVRLWLRRATSFFRARPAGWTALAAAVGGAAAITGIVLAVSPPAHHSPAAAEPGAGRTVLPGAGVPSSGSPGSSRSIQPVAAMPTGSAGGPGGGGGQSGGPQPVSSAPGSARPSPVPSRTSPAPPSPSPPAGPTSTPTPPAPSSPPTPTPTPSPHPSKSGSCLELLGVWVCLTL